MEQGTREDSPTGLTPRKRVWQYVDEWELTQSRSAVLKAWRQRSGSTTSSDTFVTENEPPPAQLEDHGLVDEGRVEGEVVVSPGRDSGPLFGPRGLASGSPVLSLASSASSVSVQVSKPVLHEKASESSIPTLGTLTDRPINVMTQRGSRRAR